MAIDASFAAIAESGTVPAASEVTCHL